MTTYRERREARAERLREWADKREAKAQSAQQHADAMSNQIPFGQPILVGHHSEGRHRRDLARINSSQEHAWDHRAKAVSMTNRAENIDAQLEASIYSDDPDAVERLAERVAGLEAERDRIKAYNASCRKGSPDPSVLDEKQRRDLATALRVCAYQCKGGAFPSYHLTNLTGNITRNRKRLEALQKTSTS